MEELTVLIVEDNLQNMELETDLLEAVGFRVLQAFTAEVGLELARREQPHLILMDVGLPGVDGLTASAQLRHGSATCHIPIVVVTAHAMKGDEEKALLSGCVGYIIKPISTRTFAATVAEYISTSSAKTSA